ncbi:hypothetical protein LPJ76_003065, partial [Coemansia sp. RSA 638]
MSSKSDEVFIGAIDQGTSSTRFLIFNVKGQIVASHQCEYENHYAKAGWVEKSPTEILESIDTAVAGTCRRFNSLGYNESDDDEHSNMFYVDPNMLSSSAASGL